MNAPLPRSTPNGLPAGLDTLTDRPAEAVPAVSDASSPLARRNYTRVGLGLMLFSGVLWAPLPVLPFLSLPASVKVALGSVLFVGVQIAWWGGTVLAGPATVRKVYSIFRKLQWWKKPPLDDSTVLPPVL